MIFARAMTEDCRTDYFVAKDKETFLKATQGGKKIQRDCFYVLCAFLKKKDVEQLNLPLLKEGVESIKSGDDFFILW